MLCETEYEDDFDGSDQNQEENRRSGECSTYTPSRSRSLSHYEEYSSSVASPLSRQKSESNMKLNINISLAAVSDNAQVIHNSNVTSVAMVEPDMENKRNNSGDVDVKFIPKDDALLSSVSDPYNKTNEPSCAKCQRTSKTPSFLSSELPLQAAQFSPVSSPTSVSTCTTSTLATTKEKEEKEEFKPWSITQDEYSNAAKNINRSLSDNVQSSSAFSGGLRSKSVENVDVWKRHSLMSYREKGKQGVPRCLIKNFAVETKPQFDAALERQPNEETLPFPRSPLPLPPAVVSKKVVRKNRRVSCGSRRENMRRAGNMSSSRSESSATQETETRKKFYSVKRLRENVRYTKEASLRLSKTPPRADRKLLLKRHSAGVASIESENNYLRRLLQFRDEGKVELDLLISLLLEELKYAKEKLRQVKLQLRELRTDKRRVSLMFFQITKQQTTPKEQIARQQREGVYNRSQLQMKAAKLREEIEMMRENSVYFINRIHQLEGRVKNDRLSEISVEEYISLRRDVKENDKLIDRLTTSIDIVQNKKEVSSKEKLRDSVLCVIDFPGREEMENILRKLLTKVKIKDEQIAACRRNIINNTTKENEIKNRKKNEESNNNNNNKKKTFNKRKRRTTQAPSNNIKKGVNQICFGELSQPSFCSDSNQTSQSHSLGKSEGQEKEKEKKQNYKLKGKNENLQATTTTTATTTKEKNSDNNASSHDVVKGQNYTNNIPVKRDLNNNYNFSLTGKVDSNQSVSGVDGAELPALLSLSFASNEKMAVAVNTGDKTGLRKHDKVELIKVSGKIGGKEKEKKVEEVFDNGGVKTLENVPVWLLDEY